MLQLNARRFSTEIGGWTFFLGFKGNTSASVRISVPILVKSTLCIKLVEIEISVKAAERYANCYIRYGMIADMEFRLKLNKFGCCSFNTKGDTFIYPGDHICLLAPKNETIEQKLVFRFLNRHLLHCPQIGANEQGLVTENSHC